MSVEMQSADGEAVLWKLRSSDGDTALHKTGDSTWVVLVQPRCDVAGVTVRVAVAADKQLDDVVPNGAVCIQGACHPQSRARSMCD